MGTDLNTRFLLLDNGLLVHDTTELADQWDSDCLA